MPASIPHRPDSFIGREAELLTIKEHLHSGARILTVVGPPGIGKTRLVLEYLRRLGPRRSPRAVYFCDLTETHDAASAAGTVAADLGIALPPGATGATANKQIGAALARRGSVLVVLDNFEQLTAFAAETVDAWRLAAPRASFLITSRERLRLPGESVYEIGPLTLPDHPAHEGAPPGARIGEAAPIEAVLAWRQ